MNEELYPEVVFPENTAPFYVLRVIEEALGMIPLGVDESHTMMDYVHTSHRHDNHQDLQQIVIKLIQERYDIDMSDVQDFHAISFCRVLYERLSDNGRLKDFDEFLYDWEDMSLVDSWACYRVVERVFGYKPSDFGYVVNNSTLEDFVPAQCREMTLEKKRDYVIACIKTVYCIDISDVEELNIVFCTELLKDRLIKEERLQLFNCDFDSDAKLT